MQVFVRDNDVEQGLRVLKKKMQREDVFGEMRRRRFFEKPSDKATRENAEAVRRSRKLARRRAIRDWLIAAAVGKPAAIGKRDRAPNRKIAARLAVADVPAGSANHSKGNRRLEWSI